MKYYVADHMVPEDAYSFKPSHDEPSWAKYAAEEAAEDYHSNHDGYEDDWPLTFVLLDDAGKELGRFMVDREAIPHFYAAKIEKKEDESC
jgi:hypothetical protein